MGRGRGESREKKQLSVYQLSECEGVAARWEKVLAEEEGGDGRAATLRPIYPKLTGLKKAVKSECDVSKRMFLEISNELGEQEPSAAKLPCERAVRVIGFECAGWTRR
jgi:hypothetical protein